MTSDTKGKTMLEPGRKLGRYRVEEQLGAGGMGEVYRAWDSVLRRWVALKVVAQGDGSGLAERLVNEARAAASLRHPNIVSVYDVGEEDGYAFVSMDLVDGRPLRDYVGDGSVPHDKQLAWLLQIASALRAAHKAGLVHRDMKPDNVMITVDGEVRVLDFGLAKTFAVDVHAPTAHEDARGPASTFLTGQGRVIGTPAYMAPEQLAGGPASPLWDEYAWGVLACELLTGKHPRLAGLISVSGWVKPDSMPSVSDPIAQIVARAMAPSPDQRFPSMDAIVAALGGPVSGAALAPGATTNPPPKAPSTASAAMNVQIGDTLPVPVHPNAPVQRSSPRYALWIVAAASLVSAAGLAAWRLRTAPPAIATVPPAPASAPAPPPVLSTAALGALVSAPGASASTPSSAAPVTSVRPLAPVAKAIVAPPAPRKLSVKLSGGDSLQYDHATVERFVAPLRPLVQACLEQHPPAKLPAALAIDLELWNLGDAMGKVRDARVNETPALAGCLRDAFMPLSFGPPKSAAMPPGAVFVRVQVDDGN